MHVSFYFLLQPILMVWGFNPGVIINDPGRVAILGASLGILSWMFYLLLLYSYHVCLRREGRGRGKGKGERGKNVLIDYIIFQWSPWLILITHLWVPNIDSSLIWFKLKKLIMRQIGDDGTQWLSMFEQGG